MIFLIEYHREQSRLVSITPFEESERDAADERRLELEVQLNMQRINNEVVTLDAENEQALRKTHRRYFENLEELAASASLKPGK